MGLWYTHRHFTSSRWGAGVSPPLFFFPERPFGAAFAAGGGDHESFRLSNSAAHISPAGPPSTAGREVEAHLRPIAAPFGFDILLVEVAGGAGKKVLRIFLDRPGAEDGAPGQGGVTIGDCAKMSRLFGNALDAAEAAPAGDIPDGLRRVLAGAYTLEVSSPGLDRPLARRPHFERAVGQRVEVKTHEPLEEGSNRRTFQGVLEQVSTDPAAPRDDYAGTIAVSLPEDARSIEIPIPAIRKANVIYEG